MLKWIKFLDTSCCHSFALETLGKRKSLWTKKIVKVTMKVLDNVAIRYPKTTGFIEDNLNKLR